MTSLVCASGRTCVAGKSIRGAAKTVATRRLVPTDELVDFDTVQQDTAAIEVRPDLLAWQDHYARASALASRQIAVPVDLGDRQSSLRTNETPQSPDCMRPLTMPIRNSLPLRLSLDGGVVPVQVERGQWLQRHRDFPSSGTKLPTTPHDDDSVPCA